MYDGELQSNDRRVELHIWAGKLQSLTPGTTRLMSFVLCACALTGRCIGRYFANSRKNNVQI